jgi:hypothetical protein
MSIDWCAPGPGRLKCIRGLHTQNRLINLGCTKGKKNGLLEGPCCWSSRSYRAGHRCRAITILVRIKARDDSLPARGVRRSCSIRSQTPYSGAASRRRAFAPVSLERVPSDRSPRGEKTLLSHMNRVAYETTSAVSRRPGQGSLSHSSVTS